MFPGQITLLNSPKCIMDIRLLRKHISKPSLEILPWKKIIAKKALRSLEGEHFLCHCHSVARHRVLSEIYCASLFTGVSFYLQKQTFSL